MKTWTRLGIVTGVLALAVAAGTGAYAMRDGDGGSPKDATSDTADQPRPASQDGSSGASSAAMCVAEVPDCNDMIVDAEGNAGSCAERADDCVDTPCVGGPAVDCVAPEGSGVCYTLDTDPITTRCVETACAQPMPGGPPTDLPLQVEPQTGIEPAPPADPGAIGTGCLGEDPCSISSEMKCLPPDCAVSSDGTIACPEPLPCDLPPVDATPITIGPDATAVAEGGSVGADEPAPPPTEPCAVDPCLGTDPYAGIPANCAPQCEPPDAPDGATEPAMPCSAPCDEPDPASLVYPCMPPEPCTLPDQPAPEGDVEKCPPSTGGGADGSSGSAPSSSGVVEPQPSR